MADDPTVPACTPHFTPGPTGCVMPSEDETKSRLMAGGTLFRSRYTGAGVNTISISCTWLQSGPLPDPTCPSNIVAINLIVRSYSGDPGVPYTVNQTVQCGSPIIWASAIPGLRAAIAADVDRIIDMPMVDNPTNWTGEDAEFLDAFPETFLSGGTGISESPTQAELDAIRTGPAFTLTNIQLSEKNTDNGDKATLNEVRYWNGSTWVPFDSVNPPTACDS